MSLTLESRGIAINGNGEGDRVESADTPKRAFFFLLLFGFGASQRGIQ